MSTLRYTVCSYIPNPYRPEFAHDFAVLIAGETEVVLMGDNLAHYKVEEKNTFASAVVENAFAVIQRRVEAAGDNSVGSGIDILDKVISSNRSNFQFRAGQEIQSDAGILQAAEDIFAQEIAGKQPPPGDPVAPHGVGVWKLKTPRMYERWEREPEPHFV